MRYRKRQLVESPLTLAIFFSFFLIIARTCCDDNGTWAELLVSPPSNASTYILGGLFGLHQATLDNDLENDNIDILKCDCQYQETVFLVEAMIYAIEQINARSDLLPEVQLGYNILGSCDTAVENAYFTLEQYSLLEMQMLNMTTDDEATIDDRFLETPMIGVIGPCSSDGGTSVANLLQSFGTPIISYGATVNELSKRDRFPTLFRTVFSDDKQVEALVDLCHKLNWTYLAAVGSEDDLGREGVAAFKRVGASKGLCLSSESYFDIDAPDDSHLFNIVQNLKQTRNEQKVVTVALLFMEWPYASKFLKYANSLQLTNITWLGVDHWTSDIGMTYSMADDYLPSPFTKGTISTQFSSAFIRQFSAYLKSNLHERMLKNKWLMHFYCDQCDPKIGEGAKQNCTIDYASSYYCLQKVNLEQILRRQRRIPNVFSAVYSAAHALDNVLKMRNMLNSMGGRLFADNPNTEIDTNQELILSKNRSDTSRNGTNATDPIASTAPDHGRSGADRSGSHSNRNRLAISGRKFRPSPSEFRYSRLPIIDYDRLISSLTGVNFTYRVGRYRSPRISYDVDGDLNDAIFEIVNFYQYDPDQLNMPSQSRVVGFWKEDKATARGDSIENETEGYTGLLTLNVSKILWQSKSEPKAVPWSYCHKACSPGMKLVAGPSACCWSCEYCPLSTVSNTYNARECTPCGLHMYSNFDNTRCLHNTPVWIMYTDAVGVICITLCVVGELLTLTAAIICWAANRRNSNFNNGGDGGYAMKTVVFINFAIAYAYVAVLFAKPTIQTCTIRLVMWQSLATANLVAHFFMLTQGRKAASAVAKMFGLMPQGRAVTRFGRPRPQSQSLGSAASGSGSGSASGSDSFALRWICEICYAIVMLFAVVVFILITYLIPPHVEKADLAPDDQSLQSIKTMLDCCPNIIVSAITITFLCSLWLLNLFTSTSLYRRARRRRCPTRNSNLTASVHSVTRRTPLEFHVGNLLWSGYLTVLVLIVIVPLYVTTDDPWSRMVFQAFTPFIIITLLLGVFALPRCWHALQAIYFGNRLGSIDGDDEEVFDPSPFVISTSNDLNLSRKMSTIPEDETSEF